MIITPNQIDECVALHHQATRNLMGDEPTADLLSSVWEEGFRKRMSPMHQKTRQDAVRAYIKEKQSEGIDKQYAVYLSATYGQGYAEADEICNNDNTEN